MNHVEIPNQVVTKKKSAEVIQLPDYLFYKWCESEYYVNRGVYNTIDRRLYEIGCKRIEQRRILLIKFLHRFVYDSSTVQGKYLKIGQGNLAKAFSDFLESERATSSQKPSN